MAENTNPDEDVKPTPTYPGPQGVCWEHQAGELPIRLSFTVKVF